MAPTDAPKTRSGRMPRRMRASSMPTCTAPRLPPPANTKAVRGGLAPFRPDPAPPPDRRAQRAAQALPPRRRRGRVARGTGGVRHGDSRGGWVAVEARLLARARQA